MTAIKTLIENGDVFLGIEFGSTRIKGVLIDEGHTPIASGSFTWENSLVDGIWTYSEEEILCGLKTCYKNLKKDVLEKYGVTLKKLGGIGISAMMHGYMPFDANEKLLVPFRTWRNTITAEAAEKLSESFNFNIPERWSVAHLYQAVLNKEAHVKDISSINTLAGYVHFLLTGEKIVGIGEASGMFPVGDKLSYAEEMLEKFDELLEKEGFKKKAVEVLPKIKLAGENAGYLTESGALLLDEEGDLQSGVPLCPPEGDAGTGMVATNSIKSFTGNVSAGTSIFAMIVLDKALSKRYKEIDVVATPDGYPVAMVHCNNCTNEINAYANLFKEVSESLTGKADMNAVYDMMFALSEKADADAGNITVYNYLSGESITDFSCGRPMLVRGENAKFTLPNLLRANLYSSVATLAIGMRILWNENVKVDSICGHGGLFKTGTEGAKVLASSIKAPITVMETAGEGGPWGMAILAAYAKNGNGKKLPEYLDGEVFASSKKSTIMPDESYSKGFEKYLDRFEKGLDAERKAVELL